MATVLPMRSNTSSTGTNNSTTSMRDVHRRPSLRSNPSSKRFGSQSTMSDGQHAHHASVTSDPSSTEDRSYHSSLSQSLQIQHTARIQPDKRHKQVRSQYPASSTEKHVEYILVASFDIDRGSVMEHQYPGPVGGDEHMLAELMLPDQTHTRSQDWTIFFLHKDAAVEDEDETNRKRRRPRRRKDDEDGEQADGGAEEEDDEESDGSDDDDEDEDSEFEEDAVDGPPLVYVLNLVNTKQDNTVKRGAVVKAMAICTRHSFLHIYKPLLLLALEQYFANPVVETLASLYDAVNSMDLSLMPRLNPYERFILQSTDAKDLFIEKFETIIAQQMESQDARPEAPALGAPSPTNQPSGRSRYGLPRDTHEFESVVHYANIPVPIKIPVALSAETVGDFSLIKLITTFSTPHSASPVPFSPTHPHLTTSGSLTHPIIVLLNALLTQKRVIFLGHNLPSSEVAEAVLGACALASGGMLRGFTRHAFPYTDLTKIDDLLKVPGFIAGVTNPVFNDQPQWWDVLCDLSTGRMRVSSKIEQAPLTEGVLYFQSSGMTPGGPSAGISALAAAGATLSAGLGGSTMPTGSMAGDPTGDVTFMNAILKAIEERHGENAIRAKFRKWVLKFTRLAAAFEETVYGASALQITTASPKTPTTPFDTASSPSVTSPGDQSFVPDLPTEVLGHGYVWPSSAHRYLELAANATRIEGWRTTRSYYNYVQDQAAFLPLRPITTLDLQHLHDRLSKHRLTTLQSGYIYTAICAAVHSEREISQLLSVVVTATYDPKGNVGVSGSAGGQGAGLWFLVLGLFHPKVEVREGIAGLLGRVQEHEAGRYFWRGVSRFGRSAWNKVTAAREARAVGRDEG